VNQEVCPLKKAIVTMKDMKNLSRQSRNQKDKNQSRAEPLRKTTNPKKRYMLSSLSGQANRGRDDPVDPVNPVKKTKSQTGSTGLLPDQPEKLKVSRGNQIGPIPYGNIFLFIPIGS